jgi:two-component system CheB/CheR fusion protein
MLNPTLSAMSGMLNTLLDMDQIDTGTIKVDVRDFEINDLLGRLRDEFTYHADARGLTFHAVSCGLSVRSDPRLLERILRNLLSNALKYTEHGKILLGCRRHGGTVSIEVWDTGLGSRLPSFSFCPGLAPIRTDSLPHQGIWWDEFASWTSDRRNCAMADG